MLPTHQKINRSITINAPATDIYEQLKKLETFNRFSVWSQQDSSIVHTMSGTDGTVGAISNWKGSSEISGEGKIEITALEPTQKVAHTIHFSKPQKSTAQSVFMLNQKEKNQTTVTWNFELNTPRPGNIFNLFYSLDKQMGNDFETGLATLKTMIEKDNTSTPPVK